MSIKVENLTKIYGKQKAVNNLSFEINSGEIVGFLGPNGAGKTTTMKILTCYIPPSAGRAFVNSMNVEEESIAVRKQIGYLPEHNPLYMDMYVKEYLQFVASCYDIKNKTKRVEDMIGLTGLQIEKNKKIGQLSKGYRQRVGLAQAMIHNPSVLILDEPTSGLDPNQIVEIRNLIKAIGQDKTVMLSTHIMQEVEAMCSRIMIINKGEIVANGSASELKLNQSNQVVVVVTFSQKVQNNAALNALGKVNQLDEKTFEIKSNLLEKDLKAAVFQFAVDNQLVIEELNTKNNSLEDIFKKVTQ